jgi:rhodanese-related sulfurtransferase
MKRNLFILILFAFVVSFANCQGQGGVQKLSVADYEKKLNETSNEIIVDVRTPEEYQSGHLVNATLINYYDSDFKEQISKLDKSKPVYVYCKAGVRSAKAANILRESGFKEVYDLQGGFDAWSGAGKPVTR